MTRQTGNQAKDSWASFSNTTYQLRDLPTNARVGRTFLVNSLPQSAAGQKYFLFNLQRTSVSRIYERCENQLSRRKQCGKRSFRLTAGNSILLKQNKLQGKCGNLTQNIQLRKRVWKESVLLLQVGFPSYIFFIFGLRQLLPSVRKCSLAWLTSLLVIVQSDSYWSKRFMTHLRLVVWKMRHPHSSAWAVLSDWEIVSPPYGRITRSTCSKQSLAYKSVTHQQPPKPTNAPTSYKVPLLTTLICLHVVNSNKILPGKLDACPVN